MAEITLRPEAPQDKEFLYALYASTREEELAAVPWAEAQKAAFLRMQFAAQSHHYHASFTECDFLVVLADGIPIGRLYLDRREQVLHIVDIALLPPWRGKGIGSALLSSILAEADRVGKAVSLHVESFNRAARLYERLGFVLGKQEGVYHFMERPPRTIAL